MSSNLTVAVVGVPLTMIFVGSTQVMVNKGIQLTLSLLLFNGYLQLVTVVCITEIIILLLQIS